MSVVISTIHIELRESAVHRCAELSSLALPFCETRSLLGALGPSGGESELTQTAFRSCLGLDAALHITVCNLHLVGVQDLSCKRLLSCSTELCCMFPALPGPRAQERVHCLGAGEQNIFLTMMFALPVKRQYN